MKSSWQLDRVTAVVATTVCLAMLWAGHHAPASAAAIDEVRVGFQGRLKVGRWVPVRIVLHGAAQPETGRLELLTPDGEGVLCRHVQEPPQISLEAGELRNVTRYVRLGKVNGSVTVRWLPEQTAGAAATEVSRVWQPADTRDIVRATQQFVLVLGGEIGIEDALRLRVRSNPEALIGTTVVDVKELPEHWYGYDGVDAIVLTAGSSSWLQSASAAQAEALVDWVRWGGRLVLAVGPEALSEFHEGGRLSALIPALIEGVWNQRETTGLEEFAGTTERLDLVTRDEGGQIAGVPLVRLRRGGGRVEASDGGGSEQVPWVLRYGIGFGQITVLTAALDYGPIAAWSGRPRLMAALLDVALGSRLDRVDDREFGRFRHLGFTDLAGQLRVALDQFAGVRVVPFAWIAGLAALYVLIIGPADYFLLRSVSLPMWWTWITFPAAILLATVLTVWLAFSWKGNTDQFNQVDLVDVDSATGAVRGTTWIHLFTANEDHYNIAVEPAPQFLAAQHTKGVLLSWQGLPGTSFGGMDNSAAARFTGDYSIPWHVAPPIRTVIQRLPMATWSSRSLFATWWGGPNLAESRATQLSVNRDGLLQGTVQNPLDVALRDCMLCFDRWYYEVGTLAPGQSFAIGPLSRPRDLRSRLTRRQIIDDREISRPWEKESLDVSRIMEMMMFHAAAGGRSYTDLLQRHHGELDASGRLTSGTAVLWGRYAEPGATLTWEGQRSDPLATTGQRTWTFCRVFFSVIARSNPQLRQAGRQLKEVAR